MERLLPSNTVLLVVDVQEKLAAAMPEAAMAELVKNAVILLETAEALGIGVVASEQYPKGLGATMTPIAAKLGAMGVRAMPKMAFDACSELTIARALADSGAKNVVVVGMEAHVCVFQTARELVKRGYATYVVADAVASRREENRRIGLSLCERAGAIVTVTETVAFDLLEHAGTGAFKAVSKLLR
ncbi:MAG: Isochorismatase [Labilithrix sp.]|nr:Isochorismatase [Labilithrix sp.]